MLRRSSKWYNIAMADFHSSTILFQFLPVKISSICAEWSFAKIRIWKKEGKKNSLFLLSSRNWRSPKVLKRIHNLVSFNNIDEAFSIFSLVTFILYIRQWFALTEFESIWKRTSSTNRPMQCSSAVNKMLIPW